MSTARFTSGGDPRRAEQVVQHVAHGDRLDAVAHPLRRRHVRQHIGQMPHHLERRRTRPDHDARLQHERRHARSRGTTSPTSTRDRRCGDSATPVRVQTTEIDDATDGCRGRRLRDGLGRTAVGVFEPLAAPTSSGRGSRARRRRDGRADRRGIGGVAGDALDAAPPREAADPRRGRARARGPDSRRRSAAAPAGRRCSPCAPNTSGHAARCRPRAATAASSGSRPVGAERSSMLAGYAGALASGRTGLTNSAVGRLTPSAQRRASPKAWTPSCDGSGANPTRG